MQQNYTTSLKKNVFLLSCQEFRKNQLYFRCKVTDASQPRKGKTKLHKIDLRELAVPGTSQTHSLAEGMKKNVIHNG